MTPEQQVEETKQKNRRVRRIGTAVLVAGMVVLTGCAGLSAASRAGVQSTPTPGVVTATAFRLVDTSGVTRAVLAMERGGPVLRFLGEKGEFRAVVGLNEFGPLLLFARDNGKPGTSMGVGGKGPSLAFADTAGHLRILLTVEDSTGMPAIRLRDTTGHVAWTAPEPQKR
jgi:hypothetical protein